MKVAYKSIEPVNFEYIDVIQMWNAVFTWGDFPEGFSASIYLRKDIALLVVIFLRFVVLLKSRYLVC